MHRAYSPGFWLLDAGHWMRDAPVKGGIEQGAERPGEMRFALTSVNFKGMCLKCAKVSRVPKMKAKSSPTPGTVIRQWSTASQDTAPL